MNRFFLRLPVALTLASVSLILCTFAVTARAEETPPRSVSTLPERTAAALANDAPREAENDARTSEIESRETPTHSVAKAQPQVPLISADALQPMSLPLGGSKSGTSSQSISIPQGAGKIEGMGESFSAQLSTGIGTFGVPFALPTARGAAQPSLALSYSSSGAHGLAGVGWDMSVPYISRQTDRGVPGYADPLTGGPWHPEQDRFVFNGGQELVPICLVTSGGGCLGAQVGEVIPAELSGWQYFRPRVEGLFMRFFWSPDHRTWLLQSKSGVTMELGVPRDSMNYTGALETAPSDPTRIFRWNISREYDAQAVVTAPPHVTTRPLNLVMFQYMQDGGVSYLTDIYDTPPQSDSANAALSRYAHHTRISYEARTDPTQSFRRGWLVTQGLRVRGVDVASKSFSGTDKSGRQLLRRYHIAYESSSHVSLLSSVTIEGRCASTVLEDVSGALPAVTGCATLQPVSFGYQHVAPFTIDGQPGSADLPGFEGFDERLQHFAASPAYSLDGNTTDLFDVNADGLPDVVVTQPALFQGKHGVFFNGGEGQSNTFSASTIGVTGVLGANAGTIVLSNANIAPQDLDGDGVIDLLHMPQVKKYSVYTPVKSASGWNWMGRTITTAAAQSPKIDFVNHDADIKVMDVNGDGLVDVVFSAGTEMQTFFSLGRYPGGDGQFGHANWTGASTACISNDPVTSCLPWSATPIKLSDSDVLLADMNGDGLTDIVRVRNGQIQYWPGRGTGLWGTGALDDCPSGSFGQGRHVVMAGSPQFSAANGPPRLEDVNGDGLADLVQVRFNAVDIWLNVDGVGWTADRHIIHNTPTIAPIQSHMRIVDANGSGTRDILWGDASDYKYIDLLGGKQPWVLKHIANGLGKTTDLEFRTSTELMLADELAGAEWHSKVPSPMQVVTRVTEHDNLEMVGRPAGTYVTEYSYTDPFYDGRQREFRGFRTAVAKRLGDDNSPSSNARSTFLLGECKDEVPNDGIDFCAVGERWRDNPREALKGLPIIAETFNEKGDYASTTHETYRLRSLYFGLDGREVRHAYASTIDAYLYDTGSFNHASSTASLTEVELEPVSGAIVSEAPVLVTLRASVGQAHTRTSVVVDRSGNATDQIAFGCLGGCPVIDEMITTHTQPARPAGDSTGWLWRTVESYTIGSNSPLVKRHRQFLDYDAMGNLAMTSAELLGTLALDRFHEDPAKALAPTPWQASNDGIIILEQLGRDAFGNIRESIGANGHCSSTDYDAVYSQLAIRETEYAGQIVGDCGTTLLTTSAEYDRGLGVVTSVVGVRGEVTTARYDGFGRILEAYKPHPTLVGITSSLPSVKFDYSPTSDAVSQPYSQVRMQTQDGVDEDDPSYRTTWSYIDGLGRSIVTFSQADPSAGDGGEWIVGGLDDYDAKGASARVYQPWFYDEDPELFDLGTMPPTSFSQIRYDAFGRLFQRSGLDGAVNLEMGYHALSSDAWDAEDMAPGSHQGTYASGRKDGHGRQVSAVERVHFGAQIEERETRTAYLPTGETAIITRQRLGTPDTPVVRWMRYDSLGRMVLNVDPNTTVNFTTDSNVAPNSLHAWRYAYDDAGDLVGTSDARGCGVNYDYDAAGRPLAEDYSPCRTSHADYSSPNMEEGVGAEVFYRYDIADADAASILAFPIVASFLKGQLVSVADRASKTLNRYDGRGRVTGVARRIAKPGAPNDDPSYRYAPRWYKREISFDGADRPTTASTGASVSALLGGSNDSVVSTLYSRRGEIKSIGGSYGSLVTSVTRDADGRVLGTVYGDLAQTTTTSGFDIRRRLSSVQTYRAAPSAWSSSPPSYIPAPNVGSPGTLQLMLEDLGFTYDLVDNPVQIRDYRNANEWPDGAKPVYRAMQYDDLYRLNRIDYNYIGTDAWVSPFDAENNLGATDPRRATPSPHVAFSSRMAWQTFAYDWLGSTAQTEDDADGFYDRSLGNINQGTANNGPYQLVGATNSQASARAGSLSAAYDASGNLTALAVRRDGPCLPTNARCLQRFDYEWDEVGRLVRALRWDLSSPMDASDPSPPSYRAAVDLHYAYDASDMRVLKSAVVSQDEVHTAYVFDSLELRRAAWLENLGDPELSDYEDEKLTEVPYLIAHGVRLARVSYGDVGVPGDDLHVLLELADHLGSNGIVIDKATGELVERTTYQAYGVTESDYRPGRWNGFREDHRFTGKEEDIEVGLTYFGARYYAAALGRWISADPLAVHGLGGDLNLYAYVHGRVLQAIDPFGLQDGNPSSQGAPQQSSASESTFFQRSLDQAESFIMRNGNHLARNIVYGGIVAPLTVGASVVVGAAVPAWIWLGGALAAATQVKSSDDAEGLARVASIGVGGITSTATGEVFVGGRAAAGMEVGASRTAAGLDGTGAEIAVASEKASAATGETVLQSPPAGGMGPAMKSDVTKGPHASDRPMPNVVDRAGVMKKPQGRWLKPDAAQRAASATTSRKKQIVKIEPGDGEVVLPLPNNTGAMVRPASKAIAVPKGSPGSPVAHIYPIDETHPDFGLKEFVGEL